MQKFAQLKLSWGLDKFYFRLLGKGSVTVVSNFPLSRFLPEINIYFLDLHEFWNSGYRELGEEAPVCEHENPQEFQTSFWHSLRDLINF